VPPSAMMPVTIMYVAYSANLGTFVLKSA